MYARTENNIVTQILRVDPATIFEASSSAAQFIECADTVEVGYLWDGQTFAAPPAPVPTVAILTQALTDHLDATAQQRRYDNRITCMVRAGFVGPFQAEGIAFATWCDTCNATAYALLAEVQAGTRPMPATEQELIDAMPLMVWPTP